MVNEKVQECLSAPLQLALVWWLGISGPAAFVSQQPPLAMAGAAARCSLHARWTGQDLVHQSCSKSRHSSCLCGQRQDQTQRQNLRQRPLLLGLPLGFSAAQKHRMRPRKRQSRSLHGWERCRPRREG